MTQDEATALRKVTEQRLLDIVKKHVKAFSKADLTYFERSDKLAKRIPQFYLTFKVHKTPLKTRPVVSCINSPIEYYSKWLDVYMKKLLPLSRTYLRDSTQVLKELAALGNLPPNAKLFTADAISMYTNIDIQHALQVFRCYFTDFADEIPDDFPTEPFLAILEIVMTSNIFQFDDTYYRQKDGAAMGTGSACMLATLYYALHERMEMLTLFNQDTLLYFKRFIDDILGIWTGTDDEWKLFQDRLNDFGKLKWTVSDLSDTAIFLDLEISINKDRCIVTKTYEKPMNLFLYIPPTSAHPPGVLKSIIYGNLQRFWKQNTLTSDYIDMACKFFQRLVARGHSPDNVRKLFREAAIAIDRHSRRTPPLTRRADSRNTLFYHLEFHPRGVTRQTVRSLYNFTGCADLSGFPRLIIAFSRPQNLRNALMRTQMEGQDGSRASDIFDRMIAEEPLDDSVA